MLSRRWPRPMPVADVEAVRVGAAMRDDATSSPSSRSAVDRAAAIEVELAGDAAHSQDASQSAAVRPRPRPAARAR